MADNKPPAKRPREDNCGDRDHTAKRARPDYSSTITIVVGRPEQKFMVHEDKLSAKSKFFKAACTKLRKEGKEGILRLPDVDPEIFHIYTEWVYSNLVTLDNPSASKPMIKLYLLGGFLDDVRLRNKMMEVLVAYVHVQKLFPMASSIKLLWKNTTPTSLLRSWILDYMVENYNQALFAEHSSILPADCVQQILLRLLPVEHPAIDSSLARASKYLEIEEID